MITTAIAQIEELEKHVTFFAFFINWFCSFHCFCSLVCCTAYFSVLQPFPAPYSTVQAFLVDQVPSFTVLIIQVCRHYKYTACHGSFFVEFLFLFCGDCVILILSPSSRIMVHSSRNKVGLGHFLAPETGQLTDTAGEVR